MVDLGISLNLLIEKNICVRFYYAFTNFMKNYLENAEDAKAFICKYVLHESLLL